MNEDSKCPVTGSTASGGKSNRDWWPNQLNLKILHQRSHLSNPMDEAFNYADEFKKLDLKALNKAFPISSVVGWSHLPEWSARADASGDKSISEGRRECTDGMTLLSITNTTLDWSLLCSRERM